MLKNTKNMKPDQGVLKEFLHFLHSVVDSFQLLR